MSDCFENLVTEDERLERERYAAAPAEVEAAPGQQPVPLGADSQADAAKEGAGVRTLREEIMPYMKRVFIAGQYGTAKEFYKALMSSAGHVDSPFDRGEGANRGSLFVRALHKPLALKTVQNHYWPPT